MQIMPGYRLLPPRMCKRRAITQKDILPDNSIVPCPKYRSAITISAVVSSKNVEDVAGVELYMR